MAKTLNLSSMELLEEAEIPDEVGGLFEFGLCTSNTAPADAFNLQFGSLFPCLADALSPIYLSHPVPTAGSFLEMVPFLPCFECVTCGCSES